jgi:mRNA-degrading endonuclease toxin of MazEF toxin-antitoxin module
MTACRRGDVVLVRFVFSDESGAKLRPGVVVSAPAYHRVRREVIIAAVTSNVERRLFGEHRISDWKAAGLLFPSVVTGLLRTIGRTMIDRTLGSMTKADMTAVDQSLRRSLGL